MAHALATIPALLVLGGCAELRPRALPWSRVALQDPQEFERAKPPPESDAPATNPPTTAPPTPAPRATSQSDPGRADVELTVPVGLGFTAGPTTLLLSAAVERKLDERWSVGPALQLGVADDRTLVSLTGQAKYALPVFDKAKRLSSFVQGGIGIVYLEEEIGGSDVDEFGLLVNVGGSVRYEMRDGYSLGSSMMLNFVPTEVVGERLYFSWDVVQIVLRF